MLADLSCNQDESLGLGYLCRLPPSGGNSSGALVQDAGHALGVIVAVILGGRIIRAVVHRGMAHAEVDQQVTTLVNNLLTAVVIAVAVLGGLTAAGLSVGVLLTLGGLTSLAIGLAFQDLLRNVLAGIFLLVERPFRIGDVITVGDLTGAVQTIELRTTALRLGDGRLAVLPNLAAFNQPVVNATAFDRRQYVVTLWVPQQRNLESVMRTVRTELDATEHIASQPPPAVHCALDIDGGTTVQCKYWLDYRECDPDAVAADLVRRLHDSTRPERRAEEEVPASDPPR